MNILRLELCVVTCDWARGGSVVSTMNKYENMYGGAAAVVFQPLRKNPGAYKGTALTGAHDEEEPLKTAVVFCCQ